MKITYKDKELELKKNSIRSFLYFEKIAEKPINEMTNSFIDTTILLYSTILAADHKNFNNYDFDEFVDWLDANPNILNEWLASIKDKEPNKKKAVKGKH